MIRTFNGVRCLMTSATMKRAVSEFRMSVPWGELRGKVWGPDHGRPVLCLHGWADNCGTFNTLIPLLPQEYRYVAVDMAGHGLSSHRPAGVFYTFPAYVADIRRVIDALQWKRFSIVGHSMGGNIAGMLSALYPEMVESVVLLDSPGFLPTDPKALPGVMKQGFEGMLRFEKQQAEKGERVYTYENALQRLRAVNPSLSEASASVLLERGLAERDGGVVFTRDFRINLKNVVRLSLEQSLEFQSRIEARVLVILASEGLDKTVSEPDQKKFSATMYQGFKDMGGVVVTVPGDHHVHLNFPERLASLVSDHLQGHAHSQAHSSAEDTQAAKL